MILLLTLIYIALLYLLINLKVIKLNFWWKLSPLIWLVLLLIVLSIPMQFWVPAGKVLVLQYPVPIVANVSGRVIEVPVKPNVDIKKGDVLYKIDPQPFIAARNQLKTQLVVARTRLKEAEALLKKNPVSRSKLDYFRVQVEQFENSLQSAEYNLEQTVVRAPADGFVTNLALRPGARVEAFPIEQVMTFVENSERILAADILPDHLRYLEHGLEAEVIFNFYPGKVYKAKVEYIAKADTQEINSSPFAVRLKLDNKNLINSLPKGVVGNVAIYSVKGKGTHIIRRVIIRMDTFMDYLVSL